MNIKKYTIATIATFIFIFVFEWLWHGTLMKELYEATLDVWRPEDPAFMKYIFISQFLFAAVFSYIYTLLSGYIPWKRGIAYGFFIGLLMAMPKLGVYAYMPIPLTIPLMWMLASVLECTGAGMVVATLYKD